MNKQKTFVETPSHTDTSIITAADAALRYIAATQGAEVPLEPFSAAVTAQALASALHPYKTPYGRKIDNKMAAAISTAKQVNRVERECGCGWRGRLEDCLRCGEVGPLCPECRETTEEAEQEQTVPTNQQRAGVYRKFNVSRTDGRDLPGGDRHGAEYFVLDVTHDKFAKSTMAAYAAACRNDYPALADDMAHHYGIAQQQAEPVALTNEQIEELWWGELDNRSLGCIRNIIAAAKQAKHAEPAVLDVIAKLIALTRAVNIALDDSEERQGIDGREHVIDSVNFDAVCDALEALEELPNNKPGLAMSAADKAEWALRHQTSAAT